MSPAVTVDVQDQFGNVITANHSTIALSITSGPAGAHFIGNATANFNNGVAKFNNVAISQAGTYTVQATDGALAIATPILFSQIITQAISTMAAPSVNSSYTFGQNHQPRDDHQVQRPVEHSIYRHCHHHRSKQQRIGYGQCQFQRLG